MTSFTARTIASMAESLRHHKTKRIELGATGRAVLEEAERQRILPNETAFIRELTQ